MRLAVVADDAGFHAEADAAILRCAREGILTSASLAANGPTAEAFARAARDAGLEIGVHLNLTSGPPLSDRAESLRACGCFVEDKLAAWSGLARAACDPAAVLLEVTAQMERVAELTGRAPAHVNGHNHVHVLPAVRDAVCAALERCCPHAWQRIPDGFRPADHAEVFAAAIAAAPRAPGSAFAGHTFVEEPTRETLLAEIDAAIGAGATFVELMVHPGSRPGTSFTASADRDRETEVLCDPALRREIEQRGIELVPVAGR